MANKTTKKDYINMLLAMAEVQKNKGCVDFLKKELETLSNRKSSGKKNKEKVAKQAETMDAIMDFLEDNSDKSYTATGILKEAFKDDEDMSIQRVTAMLKKLVEAGTVIKTVEKKTSYFKAAGVDDEEEVETDETEAEPEEVEDPETENDEEPEETETEEVEIEADEVEQ